MRMSVATVVSSGIHNWTFRYFVWCRMERAKPRWSWRTREPSLLLTSVKRTKVASKTTACDMARLWIHRPLITATIKKCCRCSAAMNAGHSSSSTVNRMLRPQMRRKTPCLETRLKRRRHSSSKDMARLLPSLPISLRKKSVKFSLMEKCRTWRKMSALANKDVASRRPSSVWSVYR